jgi:hypothetical protein
MDPIYTTTRIVAFIVGLMLIIVALRSAVVTFVLPRFARSYITRWLFLTTRMIFNLVARTQKEYKGRDAIMAVYAPISLLLLPATWLTIIFTGFAGIYWALGVPTVGESFRESGSALLTLGFAAPPDALTTAASFIEALIGLTLAALLISYLPTMYAAFSKRETQVTLLEVRAGSPPSAGTMYKRLHRLGQMENLSDLWKTWEVWFAELDETHTSLSALVFYRSPRSEHSWVTAAGAILDAAAIAASSLDIPRDPSQDICIRAGYLALRHIADLFQLPYNPTPTSADSISISRKEFNEMYDDLKAYGIAMKPDLDKAWEDFVGWRVNYDSVLLAMAVLTMAPEAPWISDRVIHQNVLPRVQPRLPRPPEK